MGPECKTAGTGRRSPHGERGLKFWSDTLKLQIDRVSLPSRGAWIEITVIVILNVSSHWSLPSRGAWIEILLRSLGYAWIRSLPSRGAWIEMLELAPRVDEPSVAPLAGSVD